MKLFDVYPLFDINIVKGKGCHVWDDKGTEYLDLYGGHAVISIGHAHPHYVEMLGKQSSHAWILFQLRYQRTATATGRTVGKGLRIR